MNTNGETLFRLGCPATSTIASHDPSTARPAGRTALVVAHGVVNRVLLTSLAEGLAPADFDRVPIEFVGVHDLRWDGAILRRVDYWPGVPNTATPDRPVVDGRPPSRNPQGGLS